MEISLDMPQSPYAIRRVLPDGVAVGDRVLRRSFVVTVDTLVEDWPEHAIEDVDADTVARLLALEPTPEVVLLGSGATQRFASAAVRGSLLQRGIGIECMDNAACARTFNLLVGEGRHVAAAFLLP